MSFVPRSLEEETYEWPPELDHLSASSFKMLVRCPEQWRQRYLQGRKWPPSLNMLAGGADHAAIEHSMRQKVESYSDLPVADVRERFLGELEQRVDNSGGINEVEIKGCDTKPEKVREYDGERKRGQEMVATYHTKVSKTIQPTAVEQSFSITVPGVKVPVIGYIDLVAGPVQGTLLDPGSLSIIERKRTMSSKSKPEPEWTMQGEVYQLFVPERYEFHISVFGVREPYVITPQTKETMQVALAPRKRSEMLVRLIADEIGFNYMRYGPDTPWPAKGKLHPWACGYCGFRPDCWGWKQ